MSVYPEKLSDHFSFKEAIRSRKAEKLKLDNTPPDDLLDNALASAALNEQARAILSKAAGTEVFFDVTSWFRSLEVNKAAGGSGARPGEKLSAHCRFLATDTVFRNIGVTEAFKVLKESTLPFDKLIWETDGAAVWLHLQAAAPGSTPRRLAYTGVKGASGQMFKLSK